MAALSTLALGLALVSLTALLLEYGAAYRDLPVY
jgi:hypothetical protein